MPSPKGAEPEHRMTEVQYPNLLMLLSYLMLFINENRDKVTTIAAPFLKKKKLSLDEYIAFMSIPGNRGDELALHLLAIMSQIHYCVITKTKIYYSHQDAFSPSAVHSTCVLRKQYLSGYYNSSKKMPTSTLH